jgi:hypothetical protein
LAAQNNLRSLEQRPSTVLGRKTMLSWILEVADVLRDRASLSSTKDSTSDWWVVPVAYFLRLIGAYPLKNFHRKIILGYLSIQRIHRTLT